MPNSLQYPLERRRDVQRKWGRLLQQTASPSRASQHSHTALGESGSLVKPNRSAVLVGTLPPRDWNDDNELDDDEEGDEDEAEESEPAVIREPDEDE